MSRSSLDGSLDRFRQVMDRLDLSVTVVARPTSSYQAAGGSQVNWSCFPGYGADHTDGMPPISSRGIIASNRSLIKELSVNFLFSLSVNFLLSLCISGKH